MLEIGQSAAKLQAIL